VRDWRNFQSSSTRSRNNQRSGWAEQGIATQLVSQIAERSVRQLAAEYAARGALEERTNIAAVAHPVGMEVVTARCRNSAEEWRRRKEIDRRAKEVIRARQEKGDEDAAARAAHTGDVVRQSAAGATEKRKRQRQAEKNKRQRKNRQVKKMHKEWEEELEKKAADDLEKTAVTWSLRRQQMQAMEALRAARRQQVRQKMNTWMAEQFGGDRVQLGRGWHRWSQQCRQQCCEPDTSVSGGQNSFWQKRQERKMQWQTVGQR
jgi:hypothetical protein